MGFKNKLLEISSEAYLQSAAPSIARVFLKPAVLHL